MDDVKGDRMAAQRERRARKRKREKKGKDTDEPQLTRTQKFALKKKEKKMKALQVQCIAITKYYSKVINYFIIYNLQCKHNNDTFHSFL